MTGPAVRAGEPREPRAGEEGMTLIEIVIAVAILGIIIVPLTAAIMLGFTTSNGTRERVNDSSSAQLLSAYAPTDIQSAKWVVRMDPMPASPPTPACGLPGGTPVLRLAWDDPDPAVSGPAKRTIVTYEEHAGPPEGPTLDRVRCDGAGTVVDHVVMVHALDPGELVITCTRDGGATGPSECPTTEEGDSPTAVRRVTLDVTVDNRTVGDAAYDPYSFTIGASRRVTTVAP
jgi:prepilin-type N-terminal cleavage/methylation domain-containing protein